jgi:MFS superfamily sulfate permease-like transporter
MRYEPKKIGKSPEIMCFACFLCAAVMVLASNVRGIYGSGIMQGIAVAFLVAMIFFAVRYVFTSFRYEVVKRSKSEDAPVKSLAPEKLELRVARQQGKRAFVYENIINLGDIISFSELPEGKAVKRMIKGFHRLGRFAVTTFSCQDYYKTVASILQCLSKRDGRSSTAV